MKAKIIILALLMPLLASAQNNILKDWKAFESSSYCTITGEKHAITKDPQTGQKTYHLEYWTFTVPKNYLSYIEQFAKAFTKDSDKAYSIEQGTTTMYDGVQLAIGSGKNTGTANVGREPGSNYVYCLFLDPDDPDGNHRYAYALDWCKKGDKYEGTFFITYATTLKYRQEQAEKSNQQSSNDFDDSSWDNSWFTKFMTLASTVDQGSTKMRKYVAGQIFDLCKTAPTQDDKDTAIDVLNSILPDLERDVADPVTPSILRNCIKILQQ